MFTRLLNWVDDRFPLTDTFERHLSKYPAPIGQNFWYLAGVLLIVVLVIQLISGIWLLMNYVATDEQAFASIQYIMRDVDYGWIIRYMHTTGSSMFFLQRRFGSVCIGEGRQQRRLGSPSPSMSWSFLRYLTRLLVWSQSCASTRIIC